MCGKQADNGAGERGEDVTELTSQSRGRSRNEAGSGREKTGRKERKREHGDIEQLTADF